MPHSENTSVAFQRMHFVCCLFFVSGNYIIETNFLLCSNGTVCNRRIDILFLLQILFSWERCRLIFFLAYRYSCLVKDRFDCMIKKWSQGSPLSCCHFRSLHTRSLNTLNICIAKIKRRLDNIRQSYRDFEKVKIRQSILIPRCVATIQLEKFTFDSKQSGQSVVYKKNALSTYFWKIVSTRWQLFSLVISSGWGISGSMNEYRLVSHSIYFLETWTISRSRNKNILLLKGEEKVILYTVRKVAVNQGSYNVNCNVYSHFGDRYGG